MVKALLILSLLLPLYACGGKDEDGNRGLPTQDITIESRDGTIRDFTVELALTREEMSVGLMFREDMDDDHGMLFYFGQEQEISFWMKNTFIPLDMIFIKKDGTIHHIHEKAKPNDLTSIPSNGLAVAVLEINGGLSQKLGIKMGDTINHELFNAK